MKMTIGKSFDNGWAGNFAQQPDLIIRSFPVSEDSDPILFGDAVVLTDDGSAAKAGIDLTFDTFVGIATSEVKTQVSLTDTNGQYLPGDMVSVMVRGIINVLVTDGGSPEIGDAAYVQIADDDKLATFATAQTAATLAIPHLVYMSGKDSNNVASVQMRTINLV